MLGFARELNVHDFARVVKRWRELADDELGRTDPAARDAQEHVRLDATMDDKWRLSGLVGLGIEPGSASNRSLSC